MEKGNVLVIGNSGVGKSTLINTVLGEERAKNGWGIRGTTTDLEIYESEQIPFRVIDTIGFEPSFLAQLKAINAVKKWSKPSAKKGTDNTETAKALNKPVKKIFLLHKFLLEQLHRSHFLQLHQHRRPYSPLPSAMSNEFLQILTK